MKEGCGVLSRLSNLRFEEKIPVSSQLVIFIYFCLLLSVCCVLLYCIKQLHQFFPINLFGSTILQVDSDLLINNQIQPVLILIDSYLT